MRWLKSVIHELLGLFVDDGRFAISILVWLALTVVILSRISSNSPWSGPVLLAGLALILIESTLRFTRLHNK